MKLVKNQSNKNSFQVNFFYSVSQTRGRVTLKSVDQNIVVKGLIEDKTATEMQQETSFAFEPTLLADGKLAVLNIKSLTFVFPDLLKYSINFISR